MIPPQPSAPLAAGNERGTLQTCSTLKTINDVTHPRSPGILSTMRRTLTLAVCLLFAAPAAASAEDVFAAKVRPILARYCFKCHGPDDKARKAKLRLDDRAAAVKVKAIV